MGEKFLNSDRYYESKQTKFKYNLYYKLVMQNFLCNVKNIMY